MIFFEVIRTSIIELFDEMRIALSKILNFYSLQSTKFVAKNSLMLLFIVWLLKSSKCDVNSFKNDQLLNCCSFFKVNSCKINIFFIDQYEFLLWFQIQFCLSHSHLTIIERRRCKNFDWFLVNLIEREFFIVFLILNCITFKSNSIACFYESRQMIFWRKYSDMLLLKSSSALILKTFLLFRLLKLYIKKSFRMNASTNCADFFRRIDVLDLLLLLWTIENLKWLTLVVENENKIEWFEILV